jgi:hypothetical protein
VLLAVVVVGVAVAVAQTLIASGANSPFAFLDFFYNTTAGSIVMAPFSVYGNIIGADNWLVVAIYAPIGVALNVALIALALRIDANYVDMALRVSQRVYERVQRARRTGSSAAGHVSAYWSAPQPPYWRGAGPIIWVGWTKLIRARYLVTMVSTVIVFMVVILVIITKGDSRLADRTPFLIVGALFYFTMLISIQAPIGFRSDIDQIAWLKSLPLRPLSVAWGQIAGLTIFLTIGGWLVLAVALPFGKHPEVIASGAALLGPYNLMMMAAENLMFLLYPARQAGTAPGDIQAIVRAFINMMLKGLVVALIALPSGAIGALLWMATGWFPSLPITVGLGFCAGGLLLVHATAVAYQRFDPSMDTPP